MVLIGADAEKLYPSLDHETTAKVVHEAVLITPITWEDLEWQEMAKYCAVCLEDDEQIKFGLKNLLPTRSSNHGCKPQI